MKRVVAFFLVMTGILLLLFSGGYYLYLGAVEHPGSEPLPDRLADLPLISRVTGAPAVIEINRMHGKEFPLTTGAVGVYGEGRQATLWISGAPGGFLAKRILRQMRDKIAEGNSPFVPLGERQVGRRSVYELEGLGQKHFYFQSDSLIIWLAADEGLAELALAQSLEFYP